jgi:hypothetical protein
MSGMVGQPSFHADDAHMFSGTLSSDLASDVSFAFAPSDSTGFAIVIGAPGTTGINLSIAPKQQGATFGPDFQSLALTDGVGAVLLPAGSDPLSVFYIVAGPKASPDYSYPYFTSN